MNVKKEIDGNRMTVTVRGKIDSVSAPKLEQELVASLDGVTDMVIDMKDVEYISSACLRVLLYLKQTMDEQGTLVIRNVPPIVAAIFEATGFYSVVTVE